MRAKFLLFVMDYCAALLLCIFSSIKIEKYILLVLLYHELNDILL